MIVDTSSRKGRYEKPFFLLCVSFAFGQVARAQEAITTPYAGSFDDAVFAVENAIIDHGLKVDHISHVGEMLARTGQDLGATLEIFKAADVFLFCSAVLSREMMTDDPMNIAHCPYNLFVAETEKGVVIGHRSYPQGAMQKVQGLLAELTAQAAQQ